MDGCTMPQEQWLKEVGGVSDWRTKEEVEAERRRKEAAERGERRRKDAERRRLEALKNEKRQKGAKSKSCSSEEKSLVRFGEGESSSSSGVSVTTLLKNLECAICMETVEQPRRLLCDHYYCKHCLDNMLVFDAEGGCSIKCPQGCSQPTHITSSETTNDLGKDYMIGGILDMLHNNDNSSSNKHICDNHKCCREVTRYSVACDSFFCNLCTSAQTTTEYYPVMFDRGDAVQAFCTAHGAVANWVCVNGEKREFICVYCKNREHRGHSHDTVEKYADVWKDKLLKEQKDMVRIQLEINAAIKTTRKAREKALHALAKSLYRRNTHCVNKYKKRLDDEREKLLAAIDRDPNSHLKYEHGDMAWMCKDIALREGSMLVMNLSKYVRPKKPNIRKKIVKLSACDYSSSTPFGELIEEYVDNNNSNNNNNDNNEVISMEYSIPIEDLCGHHVFGSTLEKVQGDVLWLLIGGCVIWWLLDFFGFFPLIYTLPYLLLSLLCYVVYYNDDIVKCMRT